MSSPAMASQHTGHVTETDAGLGVVALGRQKQVDPCEGGRKENTH